MRKDRKSISGKGTTSVSVLKTTSRLDGLKKARSRDSLKVYL